MTSELNGHRPESLVAGDNPEFHDEIPSEPSIYVRAEFIGGDPALNRVRDISISIPVLAGDTYNDYATAVETAVREIGALGYAPGYHAPRVTVEKRP